MERLVSMDYGSRREFYRELYENGMGIILVTYEDPINKLTMAVTKQEYSSIGFYCPTTITGDIKILVYIKDYSSNSTSWKDGVDLNNLIDNKLISRISIRMINKEVENLDYHLRLALNIILRKNSNTTISKTVSDKYIDEVYQLFELFGCPIKTEKTTDIVSGLDLVNQVLYQVQCQDKIVKDNSLSMKILRQQFIPANNKANATNKINIICHIASLFLQQDPTSQKNTHHRMMQSYIIENELFGPLIDLDLKSLKNRTEAEIEKAKTKALELQKNKLEMIFQFTFREILNNKEFFKTVLSGLRQGHYFYRETIEESKDIILNICDNIYNLNQLMLEIFESKHINLKSLQDTYHSLNIQLLRSNKLLNCEFPTMPNLYSLPLSNDDSFSLSRPPYNYHPDDLSNHDEMNNIRELKESRDNVAYKDFVEFSDESGVRKGVEKKKGVEVERKENDIICNQEIGNKEILSQLHNYVSKIVSGVNNNDIPVIDINHLICLTNSLCGVANYPTIPIFNIKQTCESLILIDDWKDVDMPIVLNGNNKKIITPTTTTEYLNKLSKDELKELIIILNDLCYDSKLYDKFMALRDRTAKVLGHLNSLNPQK